MQSASKDVTWNANGVPICSRFDDPYFSLENGLEETRYVFLHGNRLPERFCDGFHICELGFGTGLNFLATVLAWRASGVSGVLHFTSFEAFPLSAQQISKALAAFPELNELATCFTGNWRPKGGHFQVCQDVNLCVVVGDALSNIVNWPGKADAWYLDGFSPAKNPDLWSDELLAQVAEHTVVEGTFATYTAAGAVRRSLKKAGFDVTRTKGFGHKRHMTTGFLID
ncbi:tRNA (5-methylaminomethyl-2-thiouridine)(34)-methyltransferase MnmD [Roseobacter sp.]|uniref:tRNA (5-methylaminomethyl-2-thiouridine)(34)-methyltransferase MnmD n=1 Tax=Roseobacter sp. TaxID=1907202 RepID=UPI0038582973